MIAPVTRSRSTADDPRRLREILARARVLAAEHAVPSVVVGFAAQEGDRLFPDLVSFMESELRVEDAVFRLTRERALLFLADLGVEQARAVIERLMATFQREFPALHDRALQVRYLEVGPGVDDLSVKRVLPAVFADESDLQN